MEVYCLYVLSTDLDINVILVLERSIPRTDASDVIESVSSGRERVGNGAGWRVSSCSETR